eukprot:1998876-Alexandrium_andersonii.AAC.1
MVPRPQTAGSSVQGDRAAPPLRLIGAPGAGQTQRLPVGPPPHVPVWQGRGGVRCRGAALAAELQLP